MSIELFIGCMFSGKTSAMMTQVNRHKIAGRKCILVKHAADDRYGSGVINHAGHAYPDIPLIKTNDLAQDYLKLLEYDVIGIDEAQFFNDIDTVAQKLANLGKIIIAAGLDATYLAEPFGNIYKLIPFAEKVEKLSAVCGCGADASFTKKISKSTTLVEIGGPETYRAVCRKCMW